MAVKEESESDRRSRHRAKNSRDLEPVHAMSDRDDDDAPRAGSRTHGAGTSERSSHADRDLDKARSRDCDEGAERSLQSDRGLDKKRSRDGGECRDDDDSPRAGASKRSSHADRDLDKKRSRGRGKDAERSLQSDRDLYKERSRDGVEGADRSLQSGRDSDKTRSRDAGSGAERSLQSDRDLDKKRSRGGAECAQRSLQSDYDLDKKLSREGVEGSDTRMAHDAKPSSALGANVGNRRPDDHREYDREKHVRQVRNRQSDDPGPNTSRADSDVDHTNYRDKKHDRDKESLPMDFSPSGKYKAKDSHSRKEQSLQCENLKRGDPRLDKNLEDKQQLEEERYARKDKYDDRKDAYSQDRDMHGEKTMERERHEESRRGRETEDKYNREKRSHRDVDRHDYRLERRHEQQEEAGTIEHIPHPDRKTIENTCDKKQNRQGLRHDKQAYENRKVDDTLRYEHRRKLEEKDSFKDGSDPARGLHNGEIQHAKVEKSNTAGIVPNGKDVSSKGEAVGNEKILGKSGGVYIPPFKLAQMMKDVKDKSSLDYQRMTWDALRKSINGLVNKVNASNIKNILPELFSENLIRGRGLFARSCMKSQMASPSFTHVFAALVAVVNTKFPELGELLIIRIILQLRRAFKRNDKPVLLAVVRFVAHLVNQQVAHEILALELLTVLLDSPTDDSVEVAVGFVKECGAHLQEVSPQGLHSIFERFRGILHEGEIDKRVQFMIEGLFAIRKANFQGHPAILPELDLVEQEDQFTHPLTLDKDFDPQISLDIFKADPNFLENEKKYEAIKKDILGDKSEDEADGAEDESGEDSEEDEDEESEDEKQLKIHDETETNLVNLRRTIYLTIMSSVDFEEAGHKLMKIKLEPGQEMELCVMLLECCSQERTYLRYYGLLGQRFCMINRVYQENFDECFVKQYSMIHRLETNKLRNVAKFFAHLLGTDALPWQVLAYIRLTEEDTTSSSRIFIKILFQELSEHLGLRRLNERLNDPLVQESFDGIFPKDNPKNTRFAINFFTSIGLGGITDNLREYLKNMPRLIMQQQKPIESEDEETESSDESSSESTSDSETGSSDADSSGIDSSSASESDDDHKPKKRRRQ